MKLTIYNIKLYKSNKRLETDNINKMRTRLKEFRARHGLTQNELAKFVGVRRETIVFLEKGKYNPSLKLAHNIAKTLSAPIEVLFLFEEDEEEK